MVVLRSDTSWQAFVTEYNGNEEYREHRVERSSPDFYCVLDGLPDPNDLPRERGYTFPCFPGATNLVSVQIKHPTELAFS
jgi:hypothetical protein